MYASMPQLLQGSATLFLFSHIQILLFTYIYIGKYSRNTMGFELRISPSTPYGRRRCHLVQRQLVSNLQILTETVI